MEFIRQLVRASASVGANYIEAAENLGKADEKMKIRIARREAKESVYFLQLVVTSNEVQEQERKLLLDEAGQIRKILSTILIRLEN